MKISTTNYGLCLFNYNAFCNLFKNHEKRIKSNILDTFEKDHLFYIESLKNGSWIPIPDIDSIDYEVSINKEQNKAVFNYSGFNINIEENGIWICDIGLLSEFKNYMNLFNNDSEIINELADGSAEILAKKINIHKGKYKVSITGGLNTEDEPAFSFIFSECESFSSFEDPREDRYSFDFYE